MAAIPVAAQYPGGIQLVAGNPMTPGMPMVMQVRSSYSANLNESQSKSMKILSSIQIAFGSVAMIVQIALLVMNRYGMDMVSTGLWCGALFLISGILGVVGATRRSRGLVTATMVMTIISSVAVVVVIGFSSVAIEYCNSYRYYRTYCSSGYIAGHSILLLIAIAEFVVAIWTSALCCQGTCGGGMTYSSQQPVYFGAQSAVGNQVVIMPHAGFTAVQPSLFNPPQPYFNQVYVPAGSQPGLIPVHTGFPSNGSDYAIMRGPPPYTSSRLTPNNTSS